MKKNPAMLVVKRPAPPSKIPFPRFSGRRLVTIFGLPLLGLLLLAPQAMANYPVGSKTSCNVLAGFLSGMGHPVIGIDHFAFVIASGLLAVGMIRGYLIPIAFAMTTMLGTLLHLQVLDLPGAEIVIAGSVMLFGTLLALRLSQKDKSVTMTYSFSAIAAMAGLFHGYAYGEAIVGVAMTPTVAYLSGFVGIQLAIALGIDFVGNSFQKKSFKTASMVWRLLGLAITAIGLTFFIPAAFGI